MFGGCGDSLRGSIPTSVYREAPVTAPSQPPKSGGVPRKRRKLLWGKNQIRYPASH